MPLIRYLVQLKQGILNGKYHCTIGFQFDWFGIRYVTNENSCFYLQNRIIQTSQTGCEWYNDTSPFSIPWLQYQLLLHKSSMNKVSVVSIEIIAYTKTERANMHCQGIVCARSIFMGLLLYDNKFTSIINMYFYETFSTLNLIQ
jgi:hypothetical protein